MYEDMRIDQKYGVTTIVMDIMDCPVGIDCLSNTKDYCVRLPLPEQRCSAPWLGCR